jgi:hypothetical protein
MSTVFERSPGWAPWESHPTDDRRNVASVPCGGVLAASTSEDLSVALVKALLDANICSIPATQGGSFPVQQKCPGAALTAPGVDSPAKEDRHARD